MKKGILLSLICLLTLCGCGKIPTLKNGEEAVITFAKDKEEHKISVEELYKELKDKFGLQATVNLIDNYVLETEFKDYIEEAKKIAENNIKVLRQNYSSDAELLETLRANTSYQTIEAYQEAIYINAIEGHAIEEYAKKEVTNEEIEKYYNEESKGDVEVYQILIPSDATDSMSTEDKKKAEDAAKAKATEVINKLDAAKDKLAEFKKLVKEDSKDEATKNKDGNLGFINYNDLDSNYDELLDAVYKLKDGEFSKEVITTELGYHVVYRNASKEKDTLENLKEEIRETLANKKLTEDKLISINALKYYRELYNTKIIDSELNRQYGIYLNNIINNASSTTSN